MSDRPNVDSQRSGTTRTPSLPHCGATRPSGGSASRDESVYRDAHRFDMDRTGVPTLAFGQGIHFCVGAPLARMEARGAPAVLPMELFPA